jgi:hypothetical protein
MSNDNDQIKDLFKSAFAAENVPFSAAAWESMNAALDQQQSKKTGWFWSSTIAATIAIVLASLPFTINHSENTYSPRNTDQSFLSNTQLEVEPIDTKTLSKTDTKLETNSVKEISEEGLTSSTQNAIANTNLSIAGTSASDAKSENVLTTIYTATNSDSRKSGNIYLGNASKPKSAIVTTEKSVANSDQNIAAPIQNILDEMPLIRARLPLDIASISSQDVELDSMLSANKKWNNYMVFGFTKTGLTATKFYPNWGQRFGIGTTYKLKNHFYLNGEVSFSRDAVSILSNEQIVKYGLTKTQIEQQTLTSELLYINIPVIAQYRANRFLFGAGPVLNYLTGVKNIETRLTESSNNDLQTEELQRGYFTWDNYNRLNVGLLLDAQYQISELLHIGLRSQYGFNDLLKDQTLKRVQFEFYIKLNLP